SELFEEQARRTPDAIALVDEEQHLSYRVLRQRARALAAFLQQRGVGPEVLVALCVERNSDWLIGLLATWLAGGAYLPLDPGAPCSRLQFVLQDSQPALLLTQQNLLPLFTSVSIPLFCLDRLSCSEAGEREISKPFAGALAYMIYTSGSTGQPKGVLLPQQGLANLACEQASRLAIQPGDRVLQWAAASFDASLSEIVMALLWGATLCLPPARTVLAGERLREELEAQAITTVTLPPSTLATLLPAGLRPRYLRRVLIAGEAWS